jgi:protein-ribulosamine 3-kinase
MIPAQVSVWLAQHQYGAVTTVQTVGGGCIHNGSRVETETGDTFFLKTNAHVPPDLFVREAQGLETIRRPDGPRVPEPLCHGQTYLLMEDLKPAARQPGYWGVFGCQLAHLHNHTEVRFGFSQDNYIGSTPQPNPWCQDGFEFFGQHRLLYMAALARKHCLLENGQYRQAETLVASLPKLVPVQPASLIHGDLWNGNAMTGPGGEPALIDPAAHYGWAEAELAMTALFGGFPAEFYQAYQEVRPLEPGWASRFPIYNLYHLLNHLVIFGRGYWGQVSAILKRYGS